VALDDREATVAVETVRLAVEAGQVVSRSKQFKVIQASNHRNGVRTGETLYFGSRESQSMLRVYDKRLELQAKGREDAASYGVRWEMEFKQDRAQACAKALLTLDSEDWRAFLVGRAPLLCGFPRDHARSRIVREVSGSPPRLVGSPDRRLQTLPAGGRTDSAAAG
jgi:DNA relaxase NicK